MKVVCIVQARLGSTRLPNKVLLPLPNGFSVINEVLCRCREIRNVHTVVAAIPDTAQNDILADHIKDHQSGFVTVVRGPEHDVLARYLMAAQAKGADAIMRVTADCPLIDPGVCADLLDLYMREDSNVIAVNNQPRTWPHGYDCEVFATHVLDSANRLATDAYDREHVTPWIRRNYDVTNLSSPLDRSWQRLTLDTQEDYEAIWRHITTDAAMDELVRLGQEIENDAQ